MVTDLRSHLSRQVERPIDERCKLPSPQHLEREPHLERVKAARGQHGTRHQVGDTQLLMTLRVQVVRMKLDAIEMSRLAHQEGATADRLPAQLVTIEREGVGLFEAVQPTAM